MHDQTTTFEYQARRVVSAAIAHGACADGPPAERVGDLYRQLCEVLHDVDMDLGNEAMTTAVEFTVASINAGLIYAGGESVDFVRDVAASVRATSRELSSGGGTRF
jgi:hypothetical protein